VNLASAKVLDYWGGGNLNHIPIQSVHCRRSFPGQSLSSLGSGESLVGVIV
jgi:hypothetical protein